MTIAALSSVQTHESVSVILRHGAEWQVVFVPANGTTAYGLDVAVSHTTATEVACGVLNIPTRSGQQSAAWWSGRMA